LLSSIRLYQKCSISRNLLYRLVVKKWAVLMYRFWSVVTGADIPLNTRIGGGLLIPHPNGIVVHPDTVVGVNCLIFQQVTIGSRNGSQPPVIGNHVDIGAGAKILGDIEIGNNTLIGANAVVLVDVPDDHVAVGVPAVVTLRPK
jgi:serine O-acetyltransferase